MGDEMVVILSDHYMIWPQNPGDNSLHRSRIQSRATFLITQSVGRKSFLFWDCCLKRTGIPSDSSKATAGEEVVFPLHHPLVLHMYILRDRRLHHGSTVLPEVESGSYTSLPYTANRENTVTENESRALCVPETAEGISAGNI